MESKQRCIRKRCVYCGRYFRADYRLGERQKSCGRDECRKKRKDESHRRWVEANSGYFKSRYPNTKEWRSKNPDYQKRWRAKRREIQDSIYCTNIVITLHLGIWGNHKKVRYKIRSSMQSECRCGFAGYGQGREIQDSIELFEQSKIT